MAVRDLCRSLVCFILLHSKPFDEVQGLSLNREQNCFPNRFQKILHLSQQLRGGEQSTEFLPATGLPQNTKLTSFSGSLKKLVSEFSRSIGWYFNQLILFQERRLNIVAKIFGRNFKMYDVGLNVTKSQPYQVIVDARSEQNVSSRDQEYIISSLRVAPRKTADTRILKVMNSSILQVRSR